jgi:hypothetical protein
MPSVVSDLNIFFFANRTLALKETANSTKHLNKNENYIKIFEMSFISNLQNRIDGVPPPLLPEPA